MYVFTNKNITSFLLCIDSAAAFGYSSSTLLSRRRCGGRRQVNPGALPIQLLHDALPLGRLPELGLSFCFVLSYRWARVTEEQKGTVILPRGRKYPAAHARLQNGTGCMVAAMTRPPPTCGVGASPGRRRCVRVRWWYSWSSQATHWQGTMQVA